MFYSELGIFGELVVIVSNALTPPRQPFKFVVLSFGEPLLITPYMLRQAVAAPESSCDARRRIVFDILTDIKVVF